MSNDHDLDYLDDESPENIPGIDMEDEGDDEDFGIEMEADPLADFSGEQETHDREPGPCPFGRRKTDLIPEKKPRLRLLRAILFVIGFGTFAAVSAYFFFTSLNPSQSARSRVTDFSPAVSSPQVASRGTGPQVIPFAAGQGPAQPPQTQPMPVPVAPNAPYPPQYQQQPVQSAPPVAATAPQGGPYAPQQSPRQVVQAQQPPVPAPVASAPGAQVQPVQQQTAAYAVPPQVQASAPQAAPVSDAARVAAVPIPSPALAAQNKEILEKLDALTKNLQTTCESEEEDAAPAAAVDPDALKSLEEDRAFLLKSNRDLLTKNSWLRREERKYRLRTKELEAKLKGREKVSKKDRVEAKAPAAAPVKVDKAEVAPAPIKTGGPALPAGWEIRGLVSNFVSLENKGKQESQLLEVGDEIEGVRILGINVAKNLVITSNGVAEAKF